MEGEALTSMEKGKWIFHVNVFQIKGVIKNQALYNAVITKIDQLVTLPSCGYNGVINNDAVISNLRYKWL
jgi:hypothetical protein